MSNLAGGGGELRMTIEVKRAATGETEKYDLVGRITVEQAEQLELKEKDDVNDALDNGA